LKEVKELRELEKSKPELKEAVEDKIESIKKGYTDYPEIVDTGIGVTHEIVLSRENGKIVILKDAYDEGPDLTTSPDFVRAENGPSQSISKPSQNKNVTQAGTLSTISYYYEVQDAVDYANSHIYHYCGCDPKESPYYPGSYNPCCVNMVSAGGDCANYVSQCLFAGGQPRIFDDGTIPTGINPWYYKNNGDCNTSGDRWNSAWCVAPTLYNTMIASKRGEKETFSMVTWGDIAFLNTTNKDGSICYRCHAVFIVVNRSGSNPPLYNSHTSDRYHCPLPNNSSWTYEWIYQGQGSINY